MKKKLCLSLLLLVVLGGCSSSTTRETNINEYKKQIQSIKKIVSETQSTNFEGNIEKINSMSNELILFSLEGDYRTLEDEVDMKLMSLVDLTSDANSLNIDSFKVECDKILNVIQEDYLNNVK